MKNIQVIDGAENCTFSIFEATEEEFRTLFPEPKQDIQFAEDLPNDISEVLSALWERPVAKSDANGIHGTLFYDFAQRRHLFPASKRERDWESSTLNPAQRRFFQKTP